MKRVSLVVALLAVVALSTSAFGSFTLLEPYNGPVKIKYSNWETLIVPGQQNTLTGIADITSIIALDPSNTTLWTSDNTHELTATFQGYTLAYVNPTGPNTAEYYFTGGTYTVYYDETPDFNATYPGSGVTDGIVFLQLAGIPGIVPVDNLATPFNETTTTLYSNVTNTTLPQTGQGTGYLEITGGDYAYLFGGAGAELFIISDFNGPTAERPGFGWPVVSEDPIVGNIVPEPGTFLLVGAGLLGLGFLARRRREDQ